MKDLIEHVDFPGGRADAALPTVYLFRLDGAKDNDDFFASMRSLVSDAYAGSEFRVGAGWIPDFVRVIVHDPPERCSLTLIELEATVPVALASCRKYLPENSAEILSAFNGYLSRVIRQCRSSADPRESAFAGLMAILSQASQVMVTTAGALRSSTSFVEELPLIDQPKLVAQPRAVPQKRKGSARVFQGVLRLSALEAKTLARCVMILDAVIRHRDHSKATLHAWRGKAPLKSLMNQNKGSYPALGAVVFESQHGITLDFEKVLSELVEVWSVACGRKLDLERTRSLVSLYFPVASPIRAHDKMTNVFEVARRKVSEETGGTARKDVEQSRGMEPSLKAGLQETCDRIAKGIPFTREEKEEAAAEMDRIRDQNAKRIGFQDIAVDLVREMRNSQ